MRFSYKVVTYENTKIFDVNTKSVTWPFSLFKGKKTCSNNLRHKFTDICVSNRNQMGVYERTLHDCELNSPYLDQSFEITDDFLGFVKVLGEHKMKWPISEAVWPLFSWLEVPKFLWFGPMNYLWMYYTWNQFQSLSSDKQKPNNNTKSTYIIFVSIHVDFWD